MNLVLALGSCTRTLLFKCILCDFAVENLVNWRQKRCRPWIQFIRREMKTNWHTVFRYVRDTFINAFNIMKLPKIYNLTFIIHMTGSFGQCSTGSNLCKDWCKSFETNAKRTYGNITRNESTNHMGIREHFAIQSKFHYM